jgi:DNA-binding response OmpR family regulator
MKRVWIVDRQHWPRALLRGELLERGLEVDGFVSLGDALAALEPAEAAQPDLIVVELKGLGVEGDEELVWLARMGLPIMLLGGEVELNKVLVRNRKWAAILRRPFTLGQVAKAIFEQLRQAP